MQQSRTTTLFTRLIAFIVLIYGLAIVAGSLLRETRARSGLDIDISVVSLPLLIGISYTYLGSLLLRRKFNAWVTAVTLSVVTLLVNLVQVGHSHYSHAHFAWLRIVLPLLILIMLVVSRSAFRVKSDVRSFAQAVRVSVVLLLVALLYGVGGFILLDRPDFHQELSLPTAVHQTVDQFGLTTHLVVAHTRRARLFLDSLSVISTSAIVYVVISFFQPLRMRLVNQEHQRRKAEELITQHPGDIDDFFKLWPHDKHYYFDRSRQAGLAYHVSRGVALVVGDPFGDPDRFPALLRGFNELCFVNDWLMSFVHTGGSHMELYEQAGLRLQKIGEEAVVNLARFAPQKNNKYFRQIRNRFSKLGYSVEILQPPHSPELLKRFRAISDEWLARPGRMERRLLLGFYEQGYMQQCPVAVLRDEKHQVQGFMNLVPTYLPHTANYDLLRCSNAAPGNSNDFLVLNVIELLEAQGVKTLNLGLCPLSGLDDKAEDASLIDTALRFVYSNGDRFYSFSGLRRFKAKYQPEWDGRYIAYRGGIRNFTRTIAALARAMKV